MKRFLLLFALALGAQAAPLEQWVYVSRNLWVDKNVSDLEALMKRASAAGYTHVLLADSKFAKLGDMDTRYFTSIARVKQLASQLKLEIVPALFPIGYSNDILWHDPNLIEALPVRDVEMIVENGVAKIPAPTQPLLKGGGFADLKQWSWHDESVKTEEGA